MSRDEFESLIERIESLLTPVGFSQIRNERDGPFGSHYAEFADGKNAYRIVWDGKDCWLAGEYCVNYGASETSSWKDVAIYRAGRYASSMDLRGFGAQLVEALRAHQASHAA